MHKLFDFLDEQLAELLPLLYLFGTAVGTAYFFVGSSFLNLSRTLAQDPFQVLVFITGIAIAIAVELHAYLQQRRARQAWQELQRTPQDNANYASVLRASQVAHRWMVILMAFQMVSSLGFWLTATAMQGASVFLWGAVLLRGAVVPVLLYATGFLSRMRQDAVGVLSKSADKMLLKTTRVIDRQWGKRLDKAAQSGINLAPIAVTLLRDAGETQAADRIERIESGLSESEQSHQQNRAGLAGYSRDPGTGLYLPSARMASGAKGADKRTLKSGPDGQREGQSERRSERRSGTAAVARSEPNLTAQRMPRRLVPKPPRDRVFTFLDRNPDASERAIRRGAKVGAETAKRYRAEWLEERAAVMTEDTLLEA